MFSCNTLIFASQNFTSEHTSRSNLRFPRSSIPNSLICSVHSQCDSHDLFLIRYSFIPFGHESVYFTLKKEPKYLTFHFYAAISLSNGRQRHILSELFQKMLELTVVQIVELDLIHY